MPRRSRAAKHAGGGAWHWFDAAMDRAADNEARLAAELRRAPAAGQGYLFGRPMSASALEEVITVRAIAVASPGYRAVHACSGRR